MDNLLNIFSLQFLAYVVLATSILSFWISVDKRISLAVFCSAILLGISSNLITPIALLPIGFMGLFTYFFYRENTSSITKLLLFAGIVVVSSAAFLHKIPGYNNWQVDPSIKLSEGSVSFPFWLNFDKPMVALCFLFFAYSPKLEFKQYKEIFVRNFHLFLVSVALLFIFGTLFKYIVFDPKLPSIGFILLWMMKMLFFTVIVEELFFRFFIQNNLVKILGEGKNKQIIGLFLASSLFGIAHFSGGISFVLLAFVAGLFYGGIYLKTKRLEMAILLHFLLNSLHFFFFSYPYYEVVA